MFRSFLAAAAAAFFMIGCQSSTTSEAKREGNRDKADIKVRAPGVEVDVERGENKKVKVDVDVQK